MSSDKSATPDVGAFENLDTVRGGVQSVEVGMRVLCALADAGGEQSLGRIAESAGMPSAKAHRYLVSLMRSGFVERASRSNRYVLGAQALRIGLVALARMDVIEVAASTLNELRDKIPGSLLLAVWGDIGPTIVRWIESATPVTVNVRAGSKMPLLRSATGKVFAAYLPAQKTQPLIERELAEMAERKLPVPSAAELEALWERVRKAGLGHTAGEMLPGVLALAAPLFNHQQEVAAVIAALGPTGFFDDSLEGDTARELRRAANAISLRLGAPPPPDDAGRRQHTDKRSGS
jgi:DNA-binding IclR family transcriptional regulator